MHLDQALDGDPSQPEEERHARVCLVMGQSLQSVDVSLLQNVGGRHPALEPAIQTKLHHPSQPIPMPREQFGQRILIAVPDPVEQVFDIVDFIHHRGLGSAPG